MGNKNFKLMNDTLSLVLITYVFLSLVIVLITYVLSFYLEQLFKISSENVDYYRKVFLYFGIGTALVFPTGVFSEVLKGLKLIYWRNVATLLALIAQVVGVLYLSNNNMSLISLELLFFTSTFIANIAMAGISFFFVKEMKVYPIRPQMDKIKELTSFSFAAYVIMFSNIIIYKTDQLVLGAILGMQYVAVYQVSTRISDVLYKITTQYQESLSPIAAELHGQGKTKELQKILHNNNRWIAVISVFPFLVLTGLAAPILYVWLDIIDPEQVLITQWMNISIILLVFFRSGSNKVLLMAGHHKYLSKISFVECVLNLGLSALLVHYFGVIGVVFGTLIPNIVFSMGFIFQKASAFTGVSIWKNIRSVYLPLFPLALPTALFLYYRLETIPIASWNVVHLITTSSFAGILYGGTIYTFFLSKEEKQWTLSKIKKIVRL
jgi:O-antigen/teichoic acid export membrane protein